MNFNIDSNTGEYNLFRDQTTELINLYGVLTKYLITQKLNSDRIFGEYSHLKIDNENVHTLYILPDETEGFDTPDLFGKFGLQNLDTLNAFISVTDMEKIHPNIVNKEGKGWDDILGNLIVFPNNKIMEISGFEHEVQGANNLFLYDNKKNVYKITLKTYISNGDNLTKSSDITSSDSFEYEDFGNLESIFNEDSEVKTEVEKRAQTTILEDEVIYPNPIRKKPIRNKKLESNPFGDLG